MHLLFFNPQGNFDDADSHWTEHPDFGGQLVYVKEVAMAMVDAGHKVDIVTRRIIDPQWPEFSSEVEHYSGYEPNLRIVRIRCGGDAFLAKEQLWEHLDEFVDRTIEFYGGGLPDFTTAHYADGGYCSARMELLTGLRFSFTGHSLGAQKMDKLGMNSDNADEMEQRFRFSRRIAAERVAMQRAFRIITSTQQERTKQYAHALYSGAVDVGDDGKFSVIPPGVNTRMFTTAAGEGDQAVKEKLDARLKNPGQPHLIISSRVDKKKNIGNAVAAFIGSPKLNEKAGLVLCIRGVDDPFQEIDLMSRRERKVLSPILELITSSGLRDRVDFLNIQSQYELAATYRYFAAVKSAFVLTSFYEPFGLAPIEAVACGLSCVATKNGGPSDIFADGSAALVDPYDPADIARGMALALDEHQDLAGRSRKRVLELYTWDNTAAGYLAVAEEGVAAGRVKGQPLPALDAGPRIEAYLKR